MHTHRLGDDGTVKSPLLRQIHFPQESLEARVRSDCCHEGIRLDVYQTKIVLGVAPPQPFQCLVGLASPCIDFGDLVCVQ
jgi:hypothetical protein